MTYVSGVDAGAMRDAIGGRVYAPGDGGYEAARLPWQRRLDPRPALVVEAADTTDVQAAIRFAREQGLPFAVQSTGHGAVAVPDGGVLVKTAAMAAVEVDATRRVARVRGGALWSDVIAAAAPHGLGALSGTSPGVGVIGYTLGGGTGWLSRLHGYAADSVLRAEVVTAAGERLTATATENPDLFWALRGGSGNFGVVTELEFRLFPVGQVYAGMAMFDPARAADTFAAYREWALEEPDESNTAVMLANLPPTGEPSLIVRVFYAGGTGDAERLLAPLYEAAGEPRMNGLRETSFADAAAMMPSPPPMIGEMQLDLFHTVPDAVIEAIVESAGAVSGIELRHWGGAMARPAEDAGPIGHRDLPFSVVVAGQAEAPEEAERLRAGVRAATARIAPHATGQAFLNFLGDPERTADAYTRDDWLRLREIKAGYDPDNLFGANHNIPPA